MAKDDYDERLTRVLETATKEFNRWPKWKRDEARADILRTGSGQTPSPAPDPDDLMLD